MKKYFDIIIGPEADKLTAILDKPKQIKVVYIDTSAQCNSTQRVRDCKNPECSWFNHSQVGLR